MATRAWRQGEGPPPRCPMLSILTANIVRPLAAWDCRQLLGELKDGLPTYSTVKCSPRGVPREERTSNLTDGTWHVRGGRVIGGKLQTEDDNYHGNLELTERGVVCLKRGHTYGMRPPLDYRFIQTKPSRAVGPEVCVSALSTVQYSRVQHRTVLYRATTCAAVAAFAIVLLSVRRYCTSTSPGLFGTGFRRHLIDAPHQSLHRGTLAWPTSHCWKRDPSSLGWVSRFNLILDCQTRPSMCPAHAVRACSCRSVAQSGT